MATRNWQRIFGLGIGLAVSVMALAAPQRLSDLQLDEVYAAGFNIQVDLTMDIAASNPDAVFISGSGGEAALQQFLDQGMTVARTSGGARNNVSFDPTGAYLPDLERLTVNNLMITDNALQNSQSLVNVFALEGDVAIGVNLNVVVNPIDSIFNVTQTNINWSTLGLSDAFTTLIPGSY